MGRKSPYTAEFKKDALALYRAAGGKRTYVAVAADVGISGETLRNWVRADDGRRAGAAGVDSGGRAGGDGRDAEPARLREENARYAKAEKGVAAGAGDPAPGGPVFRPGDEVKAPAWGFISAHAERFGIKRMCRVLEGSRSGYYRWIAGTQARAARQAEEDARVEEIREIHAESKGAYGAPRVHAGLRAFGHTVKHKRVTRLMSGNDIVGRHLRRATRTTVPDPAASPAPDLLGRDFTAESLDQRWCGDITYIPVGDGQWLSLASVIDICSRRVIGYSMATHMRAELVTDALEAAVRARGGSVDGVVFHSDRGAQYTSAASAEACDRYGIRRSMGKVGSSYDNALAESLWQGLKREAMYEKRFLTVSQARLELFQWITWYNTRRRHSALFYLSPTEFEQQHLATGKMTLVA
ncbi:IS3 family transposase [Streptomyces sp. GD-15H]|uniref:IS3 family transposase n=1 Tax=Streptomyces sp. GD-15H TaxID=3129112 RepID=UPI00324B2619